MRIVFAGCLFAVAALAGCHSNSTSGSQGTAGSSPTVYHLRGKVVSTDTAHGIVVVDHEAIPSFMDAMTMPYQLKDPTIASELHPGDTITADVLVSKSAEETVVLDHIVVIAQAKPDYKPEKRIFCASVSIRSTIHLRGCALMALSISAAMQRARLHIGILQCPPSRSCSKWRSISMWASRPAPMRRLRTRFRRR